MAHKTVPRPHAVALPAPPRTPRPLRQHAVPRPTSHAAPRRHTRISAPRRGCAATRRPTRGLPLAAVGVACSRARQHGGGPARGRVSRAPCAAAAALGGRLYPLLLGVTVLILLRTQLRVASYERLRRWLRCNRQTPRGPLVLYVLVLVLALAVVSALLAAGEALLVRLLAT